MSGVELDNDGPASPFDRESQKRQKRRAVIRAAGQAFRRHGYHNTGMVEIAQALGLTKAALYYYVKNKEEILYECHLMVYGAMDKIIDSHMTVDHANALERLSGLFHDFVTMLTSDGLSLLTDVNSLKGAWRTDILSRRARIERQVTEIVKDGIEDGSIRSRDAHLSTFFFMGALNSVSYTHLTLPTTPYV